jgi:hypothetical protein
MRLQGAIKFLINWEMKKKTFAKLVAANELECSWQFAEFSQAAFYIHSGMLSADEKKILMSGIFQHFSPCI